LNLEKKNETYINKIKEANKSIENSAVEGESMTEMIKKHMEGLSDGFNKETDLWKDLTEIVKNSVGPGPDSNSNLTIFNQYYDYLATLTVEQQGALANILLAIVIFFCLITLISVFFGEVLITYYNLEQRLPRLTRIIKIRRTFQKYYFILNSLIIFIVLLAIIFINILTFIY